MTNTLARPTRRTLVRGAAWSVPVVSIAAAAPAFATSGTTGLTGGAAVKWGKDANDLWHVSWDLTLTNGLKRIDTVSITFKYIPTSGRSFDTFDIRGFNPTDTGWLHVVNPVTVAGEYTVTATHSADIVPSAENHIHVDFAGLQNNSAGTVSAVATITYDDSTTATVTIPSLSWTAGSQHTGH